MNDERYSRQTMLAEIGHEGQKRLSEASVLIVGLGGLGAPAAVYLTSAGIGRIGLCDNDTVSESNLQRQVLYTEAQIGHPKTEAAMKRLSAMSSHTRFDLHPDGLTPDNAATIIAGYDIVVDCCDNYPTRYLIDDTCDTCRKPWVYASIGEFSGQLAVMNRHAGIHYRDLYPDRDRLCGRPRVTAGVLGTVPGVIGALEANEVIKIIARFGEPLDGRLLTVDFMTLHTEIIEF